MAIPFMENVFYSEKFNKMTPQTQQNVVNDLKSAFEGDVSKLDIADQAVARDKFYKDLAQKQNEMMGTPIPKTPKLQGLQYLQPDKTQTLLQKVHDMNTKNAINAFQAQDQPLQDSTLDFVPMIPGGIAKNIVVNHIAQSAAQTAGATVDKMTPQYMKDQHPDYYNAMQMVAQFGAGGLVFNHAIPKGTLTHYQQIDEAVKKGDLSLEQANQAVKDVNNLANEDLVALAQKHLDETKQAKVSDTINNDAIIQQKTAQIQDAHINAIKQDALIKATADQLIQKGVTDPNIITEQINKNITPSSADVMITHAINDGNPLPPDLSGPSILVKLKNTIDNPNSTRTPDEIYGKLINSGATDELARVAAASFEQRNPMIFENWYNDKLKTSIANDTQKTTEAVKPNENISSNSRGDISTAETASHNTGGKLDATSRISAKNDTSIPRNSADAILSDATARPNGGPKVPTSDIQPTNPTKLDEHTSPNANQLSVDNVSKDALLSSIDKPQRSTPVAISSPDTSVLTTKDIQDISQHWDKTLGDHKYTDPNFTLNGDLTNKTRNLENIQVEDWVKAAANLQDRELSANLFILQAKHPEYFKNTADVYRTIIEIKNDPTHFYKNNRPDISLIAKRLKDGSMAKMGIVKDTNQVAHLNKSKRVNEENRLNTVNKNQLEVGSPYPTLRPNDKSLPEQGGGAYALSQAADTIIPKIDENSKINPNILQSSPTVGAAILGSTAGIQVDQNGNISYNLAKGVIGALGASLAFKGASKLYEIYKARGLDAVEGALPPQSKTEALRQLLQDKFTRVAQLQKVKAGAKEIADEFDTYRAEERYSGRTQNRVETFWRDKADPILKEMALKDIKIKDVDSYLHARHAIERNAKMKEISGIENGSGMSDVEAAKILLKFKDNKEIASIANKVYDINRERLSLLLKSGLENPQKIKDIEAMYNNYTPLNRDMGDRAINQGNGKGFSVKGSGLKQARGSDLAVESPLMHTILNYQDTLVRAEKNKVGQTFLNFIKQYPDESLYSVENIKYMPQYTKDGVIKNLNPLYKKGDNILHVMVDGKTKQIEIKDPNLAIALKNLNQIQMNAFLKVAHKGVRAIASLATKYNPGFFVSNMERDLQTALINIPKVAKPSYFKFLRDIPAALRGIYRDERGKTLNGTYQRVFQGMKANGGTTGWLDQFEIPQMRVDLEQKIRKYQGKDLVRNTFTEVLKYIDDINTAVENTPRLIAYKQSIDAGLTPAKAANIAKNLTVNFNKKGTGGTFLNTVYMFYNASIQGSVRTLQALKSTKGKIAISGIAATGYGLHQYNEMINKDAYNKISQFERDTNYIFMLKDGTYLKVKLPYGYNIFKVMGDIAAEIQNGEATKSESTSRLFSAVANAFSPIGASVDFVTTLIPTLAKPFYEIKTNQNFFGGQIKPEGNPFAPDKLAQSHQYFQSVNPLIKDFAQQLNALTGGTKYTRGYVDVSPEYIQHLAEFITSGLGTFAIRSATSAQKAIKGEKQDINQISFYRLFVGKARDKIETNIAYNLYNEGSTKILSNFKVKQFKSSIVEAVNKGDLDPKKAFQLWKKFQQNQARAKWSRDNNIQNSTDTLKNLGSAAQYGVSKRGLIDLAKESIKDLKKNPRNPRAPLIKF